MSRLHKEVQVLRELSDKKTNQRGFLVKPEETLTANVQKIDSNSITREEIPTYVQTQPDTRTQNSNIIQETTAPKQSESVIGEGTLESKSSVQEPATLPKLFTTTEPQKSQGEVQVVASSENNNVNTDDLLGEAKKEMIPVVATTTIEKLVVTTSGEVNNAAPTDGGKEDHDSEETDEVNNADISNEDTKIDAVAQHSSLNELANEEEEEEEEDEEENK